MTTDKHRVTVYLADRRPLDDLYDQVRRLAPIEARGQISRSTVVEAAVAVALDGLRATSREAAIYSLLVTLPGVEE